MVALAEVGQLQDREVHALNHDVALFLDLIEIEELGFSGCSDGGYYFSEAVLDRLVVLVYFPDDSR